MLDVHLVEHEAGRLRLFVVTTDAVLSEECTVLRVTYGGSQENRNDSETTKTQRHKEIRQRGVRPLIAEFLCAFVSLWLMPFHKGGS